MVKNFPLEVQRAVRSGPTNIMLVLRRKKFVFKKFYIFTLIITGYNSREEPFSRNSRDNST